MTKDKEGGTKKLVSTPTGCQRVIAITSEPKYVNKKGTGSSVSIKPIPQRRFIDMKSHDSLALSDHISLAGSVNRTTYGGTEWETISKINKPFNN